MQLTTRQLSFIEVALDAQIEKAKDFHARADAGEFPGYDPHILTVGKAYNEERTELLQAVQDELRNRAEG